MKKNYDFSEAVKNPYAKLLKKQLTIRVDTDTIGYFQELAQEYAVPRRCMLHRFREDLERAAENPAPRWVSKRSSPHVVTIKLCAEA